MSQDFPVQWLEADDATLFFVHERSHFPGQVKPLDFSLNVKGMEFGFNQAAPHYAVPLKMLDRCINTYVYEAISPVPAPDDTTTRLEAAIDRLGDLWEKHWLPEIQQHLAFWEAFPLADTSLEGLLAHLGESRQRLGRVWDLHFQLFFPMMVALSRFENLHADLFGKAEGLAVYRLLAGFKSKTVESNEALWQLSRWIETQPALLERFHGTPPGQLIEVLKGDQVGRECLSRLGDFLEVYGKRSNEWSIDQPFWIEDPTPVLAVLKDFLSDAGRNPLDELQRAVADREAAVVSARTALTGYPQPVVAEFETALATAQHASFLSEDHFFWIEGLVNWQMRRLCVALGEALAGQGLIEQPEDVFYLQVEELLSTPLPGELRQWVIERRALEQRFAHITPPETLGTPPDGPPPADPVSQALAQFYGEPPEQPSEEGHWLGFPASSGTARGTARIIHSLAEAHRVQHGDILVAPTTAPPWTSLFATIAGLVTDTGGVLSHGAIVAREYNIPAVVGVGTATTSLQDGQYIEINGSTGEIRLLPNDTLLGG